MIDFSKINKKLKEDNVFFMDEADTLVVIADVSEEEALKALNLYEEEMGGDSFDKDTVLTPVSFYEAPSSDGEEGWIWWEKPEGKSKFLTKGWIYSI